MLPAHRTEGEGFSLPQFDLTPCDVDGFLDELQAFHDQFRGCFSRSEPREHFFNYMVGQCSALERKSIEPMARHVDGGTIRGMQRCMSDDVWDEDTMRETYHDLVANEMGDLDGVLIVDETGFLKKGTKSCGVARQYTGTAGDTVNCQVGVFLAYASERGAAFIDRALYLPRVWTQDVERRAEAVFGATDEKMQMTPHEPQEAVRLDERRFRERCGSARGERVRRERTLQIAQAAGASLHVRLVRRLHCVERVATSARHGCTNGGPPARGKRS